MYCFSKENVISLHTRANKAKLATENIVYMWVFELVDHCN